MGLFDVLNVVNQVRQIKQNPSHIGKYLYDNGRIDQRQMEEIEKMGGNVEQIGQYLMNQGFIPPQDKLQSSQPYFSQIQRRLK